MKRYGLIYCDPPWQYQNKTGGTWKSGADKKYATMTLDGLKSLNIPAAKDCILLLWTTTMLPDSLELIRHWGFEYKTLLFWDKTRLGMGFWFRVQTEFLLVGIRGKVKPFRSNVRNIHYELPTKHSKKPSHFRKLAEFLYKGDKLEMFARSGNRAGWDLYGIEAENSIEL